MSSQLNYLVQTRHNLLLLYLHPTTRGIMKVEIVESDNKSELDDLINACIQDRDVFDIKLTATALPQEKIQYTALIMLKRIIWSY